MKAPLLPLVLFAVTGVVNSACQLKPQRRAVARSLATINTDLKTGPIGGNEQMWPWFLLLVLSVARRSRRRKRTDAIG